jgi:tetratricopeptide (TPR) repeat protein
MPSKIEAGRAYSAPSRSARAGGYRWAGRSAIWIVILAVSGLNAWWAWDARSLESLQSLARWVDQKRLNDAERELRRWLRQSPHHGEARMLLARVLAARGDLLGSATELHRVPSWWPNKGEALFLEGEAFLGADRARDAEAAWKASLADDPLHAIPVASLTAGARELLELYQLEGRGDEARAVLWSLHDRADPASRATLLARLLNLDRERAAPEDAAARLRRFVNTVPDDWEARRALARAEQALGRGVEASRQILACLNARPADLRTWRDRLAILRAQGDLQGLAVAVAHLPADADHDGELWKDRGLARVFRQDWTGAAAAFDRGLKVQPDDAECHDRLAVIAERLEDAKQAEWHRRQSQDLHAAQAELPQALRNALQAIRAPQTGHPAPPKAIERLAALCKALGRSREAEAWSDLLSPFRATSP